VERGEKIVSLATVLRVANALGVRISSLFAQSQAGSSTAELRHLRPPMTSPATGSIAQHPEVNRLLGELQAQRSALRQALRELSNCLVRVTDSAS
jgi:hypothetical protein